MKTKLLSAIAVLGFTMMSMTPTSTPEAGQTIAMVSVYCSKKVDMSDFTGNMIGAINALANSEDFRIEPFVDELHKKITGTYMENIDFDFMPEAEVLGHAGYDETLNDGALISGEWMIRPEGYQSVHAQSKKAQKAALEAFPEVDGIMMVGIDYKLVKMVEALGFGTAKVQANVHLKIVDRKAKKMLNVLVSQKSDGKIKFALGGVFDTKELMPLIKDATENALVRMDEKIIRKQK
ncbi:MAG: hypothetical protein KC456_03510 [Flavobacteriales bacterium]|jgi:hypothetical protein|nr:hypothetical protein [Flavobacteriales bacterium]